MLIRGVLVGAAALALHRYPFGSEKSTSRWGNLMYPPDGGCSSAAGGRCALRFFRLFVGGDADLGCRYAALMIANAMGALKSSPALPSRKTSLTLPATHV